MSDHPTLPPIDPAFTAEVHQLTTDAQNVLRILIAPLCERVGAVITQMDLLAAAAGNDDAVVNDMRDRTGYDLLIHAMAIIASHACAAADEPTGTFWDPEWYERLRKQREARWAEEVA